MKAPWSKLAAALLLTALTVLAWQFRFEQAGPPLSRPFEAGLPGWNWVEGPGREGNPDTAGTLTLNRVAGEPQITVERVLGPLEGVRFLHVEMDAKWTDAHEIEGIRWATCRALICSRLPDGKLTWPHDGWLVSAYGTSDWHHEDAVFDLMPDSGEFRFALQHLGERGTLQVRNVEISVVHQRRWFPAVTVALVGLWIVWAAWWLAPALTRWRWLRALLAGSAMVAAWWVLVFPQPRFCARSLVGELQLGPPIPAPTPVIVPPPTTVPVPVIPPPVQPEPGPPVAVVPPPVIPADPLPPPPPPVAEKREARVIDQEIRSLRERFNFLHLAAFGAFGLALFGIARPRVWPIAAVIAFCSEALPNYEYHQPWDRGDIGDLIADGSGLLLAALAVVGIRKLWKRRRCRVNGP